MIDKMRKRKKIISNLFFLLLNEKKNKQTIQDHLIGKRISLTLFSDGGGDDGRKNFKHVQAVPSLAGFLSFPQ
jgi:hypothetical protein